MKKLFDFILESLSQKYLISNVDEAIKYLNDIGFFNNDPSQITEEDIKLIFNFKEKNKKNSPIVADYKGPGTFAFRRWVQNIKEINEKVNGIKKSAFKGFHNTSLKEDGNWEPSAGDMEFVLSFAYNKKYFDNDNDNIKYVTGKGIEDIKSKQIIEYYDNNKENIDKCISYIVTDGPIRKCENGVTTNNWYIIGGYSKNPDNTAKTDLISKSCKYKISLKKLKGAQLMSGGYNEAKATILSSIDYITDDDDKKLLVTNMGIPWAKLNSTDTISSRRKIEDPEIFKYDNIHKNITEIINKLVNKYPDFKKAIVRESATGEFKFGKNSPATANYVLLWDIDKPDETTFMKMDDYIDEICTKQLKIYVNFKSAGNNSWSALRIESK